MTRSLGGAELATSIRNDASVAAAALAEIGVRPKLAVVQATDDESTAWYVRSIASAAKRIGILCDIVDLGAAASTEQIRSTLVELGHDPDVHGIILQTPPLPDGTDLDAPGGDQPPPRTSTARTRSARPPCRASARVRARHRTGRDRPSSITTESPRTAGRPRWSADRRSSEVPSRICSCSATRR